MTIGMNTSAAPAAGGFGARRAHRLRRRSRGNGPMAAALAGRGLVRRHRRAARGARLRADRAAPTAPWGLSRRCPRRPRGLSAPRDRRSGAGRSSNASAPRRETSGPAYAVRYSEFAEPPAAGRRPAAAWPRILGRAERRPGGKIRLQRTDERAHSERHQPVRLAAGAALDEAEAEVRRNRPQDSPGEAGPPAVGPPLPPPAPREAAKPDESARSAPKPEPKVESAPPDERENASSASAPARA